MGYQSNRNWKKNYINRYTWNYKDKGYISSQSIPEPQGHATCLHGLKEDLTGFNIIPNVLEIDQKIHKILNFKFDSQLIKILLLTMTFDTITLKF